MSNYYILIEINLQKNFKEAKYIEDFYKEYKSNLMNPRFIFLKKKHKK